MTLFPFFQEVAETCNLKGVRFFLKEKTRDLMKTQFGDQRGRLLEIIMKSCKLINIFLIQNLEELITCNPSVYNVLKFSSFVPIYFIVCVYLICERIKKKYM